MLGKYITVDGVKWPNPVTGTFAPNLNPIENKYQTENGHTGNNIVRLNRFSFDARFDVTSAWRDIILTKCQTPSCTVVIEGHSYTGTLRLSSSLTMASNSERTKGTNGLWSIAVRFEED